MTQPSIKRTITTVTTHTITKGEVETLIREHLFGPVRMDVKFLWPDSDYWVDSPDTLEVIHTLTEYNND